LERKNGKIQINGPSPINPAYLPLYKTKKRIIIVTGGRGSAKSFEVSRFLTRLTFTQGHVILFTRYTMESANLSIIPEFKDKIDRENIEPFFHITKKDIVNTRSGSTINFRGIKAQGRNQTARLKSIQGLTTFVVDETEEWPSPDEFKVLSRSIRMPEIQNRIIIIMNPSNAQHWVWDMFFRKTHKIVEIDGHKIEMSTHPDVCHIHTTYLDNLQHLSEDFLNDAAYTKANNPEEYRHAFLGGWELRPKGVIYDKWEEGEFDESLPYLFGLDFGYKTNPTALVKVAVDFDRFKIYAKTLIYSPGLGAEEILQLVRQHVGPKETIIADSADGRLIDYLYENDLDILGALKPPGSVLGGIKIMQSFTFIVSPDDHDLKHELNNYRWTERSGTIPLKENDHALDAIRYAFSEISGATPLFIG
jgi:phage terminase large subunit